MDGSEHQDSETHDPGLSEAPTGAPAPQTEDPPEGAPEDGGEVNESHPNEGDIEEAVENVGLSDSPEDVNDASDEEPNEEL